MNKFLPNEVMTPQNTLLLLLLLSFLQTVINSCFCCDFVRKYHRITAKS